MNRTKLKTYAPQARRDFIRMITDRAAIYGLTEEKTEPVVVQGDTAIIGGKAFPASVAERRGRLEERIVRQGFDQVMEAVAYTWFNRFVAIRFMELHQYLGHGYRVLSHPEGKSTPEIVERAEHVDLPGLDKQEVINLKLDGTKESELYRLLLIAQCNALHQAMPFLFERIADETELLLPDNLLHSDSIIRKLVAEIEEADWQQVEIIGWLYQFYISEKKDEVIGKVVKSEDIPAATQLFTPNWIVKYLVQNTLGRLWLATYPDSPLKAKMEFYIKPAEQTPEVQAQLKAITPESLNPEELTLLDPACGSGHILVEAYDLLKEIYLERGYRLKDIPKLILTKNLFGLEIDDRAAQLAAFALLMKARADDRRLFDAAAPTNVLAIQESNGLNINALVQAFSEEKLTSRDDIPGSEFGFRQAVRSPLFATEKHAPATVRRGNADDLKAVLSLFEDAKTYGSLIHVPAEIVERLTALDTLIHSTDTALDLAEQEVRRIVGIFIKQATTLSRRYSVVAANPPYMGGKGMYGKLKRYGEQHYPEARYDLFAMFIERGLELVIPQTGSLAMVVMEAWMFLSSYEGFRSTLFDSTTITSLLHMPYEGRGRTTMGIAFGTSAVVLQQPSMRQYRGHYCCVRYTEIDSDGVPFGFPTQNERLSLASTEDHLKIPGTPVAYWITGEERDRYAKGEIIAKYAQLRKGLDTGENATFLRFWHEVSVRTTDFTAEATATAKWFPYNKGGDYRRWYGNREYVINWGNDGAEIRSRSNRVTKKPTLRNQDFYFRPGYTWTTVSSGGFSARYCPPGALFDNGGCTLFADSRLHLLGALLNSCAADRYLDFLSPTLNYQPGDVGRIPFVEPENGRRVEAIALELVDLVKQDWDSQETSWDFAGLPLLRLDVKTERIAKAVERWKQSCAAAKHRAKGLEEENNHHWIKAFHLSALLSADVRESEIVLQMPTEADAAKALLSYLCGCAMGRYNLDEPGLIYADSGNEGFDPTQYKTLPADKDGIIPVTDIDWFSDAAASRFEEFVGVAWPKEHLEENLKFVADSLGPKSGEQPRETIRRYFANDFYKHHLQTYKRRPIYWLFTSGKFGAFQCLVYLHRYNEGTLARMRTEYVIPLQGKIAARIEKLEGDKVKATSTSHRKRIEKEQDTIRKQQQELTQFDEKLRHYADQRISLNLDDGVKVNYAKFGDLLAEVKAVCGKPEDDE